MKAFRIILGFLALPFGAAAVSIALISLKPAVPGGGGGPEPGERSLITWAEIEATNQGTFTMPDEWGYSDGIHAQLSNGNIIATGPIDNGITQGAAIASLPGTLDGSEATLVGSFFDPDNDLKPTGWPGGSEPYEIGGMLEIGSRLYYTKHQWYNASGVDWETIGYNTNYAGGAANAVGMWAVTGTGVHNQRLGGYMTYAPEAIIADGYSFLAGQSGQSGAANNRWGPNLFAVKVDDGDAAPGPWLSKPLIFHQDTLHESPGWAILDKATCVWIETENRHGLLCFIAHAMGEVWYGPDTNPSPPFQTDPYPSGESGHKAEGYGISAWLYDPADLMEVYNGTRGGWTLEPYEKAPLITRASGTGDETYLSIFPGTARQDFHVSLRDGRLIVIRKRGAAPSTAGHVFDLNEIE